MRPHGSTPVSWPTRPAPGCRVSFPVCMGRPFWPLRHLRMFTRHRFGQVHLVTVGTGQFVGGHVLHRFHAFVVGHPVGFRFGGVGFDVLVFVNQHFVRHMSSRR